MAAKAYRLLVLFLVFYGTCYPQMQTVRINCETPNGYVRQLLLGFTDDNTATDGVDYGYDGPCVDNFPDDLNWIIEDNRYVIQGVGAFDNTKQYPLGIFLQNSGSINISLLSIENFNNPINLFIYDAILDSYTQINNQDYSTTLNNGNYLDRFYLTFYNPNENLGLNNVQELDLIIKYIKSSREIIINSNNNYLINNIKLFDLLGKELLSENLNTSNKIRIPSNTINSKSVIIHINTDYGQTRKVLIIH
ncbi:hypothetical protein [Pontimicrobium sp. IMCC45349]|uniref:hypothetical protein n=1 Tax=Pontimicrobium sp. IMCC45349 TaxID=3391574 RepID=UPI0039A23E9C